MVLPVISPLGQALSLVLKSRGALRVYPYLYALSVSLPDLLMLSQLQFLYFYLLPLPVML
ncbi:hypothetical protein AGMMS49592_1240 [Endomicrobiia bacterium]|nr:hypothetical protein AGMMS49592_1240 [Endomicrobiia bacterium]